MKKNLDCIRDVLMKTEALLKFTDENEFLSVDITDLLRSNLAEKYSDADIIYSAKQLIDANYLFGEYVQKADSFIPITILDLTDKGHEFLDNTRKELYWGKVKTIFDKLGACGLNVLSAIATKVIMDSIA